MYVLLFKTMPSVRSHAAASDFYDVSPIPIDLVDSTSSGYSSVPYSVASWL